MYKMRKLFLLIEFSIRLLQQLTKVSADGKVTLPEALSLMPYVRDIKDFFIEFPNIKDELAKLSKEDKAELFATLQTAFLLSEKQVLQLIDIIFSITASVILFNQVMAETAYKEKA